MPSPPVLVRVERDGVTESVHYGNLVVATADGSVVAAHGDPDIRIYPRSALKPLQALATLEACERAGVALDTPGLATVTGSHTGSATHQVEVARLLALADLDESALQCPRALPGDLDTLLEQREPTALAHNCSGKHAGFLLAHTAAGGDPRSYLDPAAPLQRAIRDLIARAGGAEVTGPGVDGCGAPAWLLPLHALATAFARLAGAREGGSVLGGHGARVRDAMATRPELVGGRGVVETQIMTADGRVVAKRGAEAVLAAGFAGPSGPIGVALKVTDGGARAAGPAMAAALAALGAVVPDELRAPPVLGGGQPHGAVVADPGIEAACRS